MLALRGRALLPALLLALCASPASAAPPADAFCVILIEPNADFSLVRVLVDEDTTLAQREALWPDVDLDGDGEVSPLEKDGFRWSTTRGYTNASELDTRAVTLTPFAPYTLSPEQKAVYAVTWRQVGHVFHKQEYALPDRLTQPVELETQEVREFGFQLEEGRSSRFTLQGGRSMAGANLSAAPSYADQGRPVIEYVVVKAPKGWVVERIEGRSYNGTITLDPMEREVDVPAFDTKSPYLVTFLNPKLDKELGKIEGPAPAALLTGLGLLGLAAVARQRRP